MSVQRYLIAMREDQFGNGDLHKDDCGDGVRHEDYAAHTTTMREALQHIADGSENVCIACGWIGNEVRFDHGGEDSDAACPNCGSLDVEHGADEIAAYALRQIEGGGE